MSIRKRRKIYKIGGTRAIQIDSDLVQGEVATTVADRLFLVDPRGEIPEQELQEFFEEHLEPAFWKWREQKKKNHEQ